MHLLNTHCNFVTFHQRSYQLAYIVLSNERPVRGYACIEHILNYKYALNRTRNELELFNYQNIRLIIGALTLSINIRTV